MLREYLASVALKEPEEDREKEGEKKPQSKKRPQLVLLHINFNYMRGWGSISWRYDRCHSFLRHSYPLQTGHRHRPSYRRTWAHCRHKQEVWRCRTVERTTGRILARMHQEEVLAEGGSSGCIRTRQNTVVVGRPRAGTDAEYERWLRWMDPAIACSSRR